MSGWVAPPFTSINALLIEAGWAQEVVEFDGPATSHILGHRYVTLTHNGPKAEGEPTPGELVWTEAEAWHRFNLTVARYLSGAKQVAWRERPTAQQDRIRGDWRIHSRLYWDTMKEAA